MASRSSPPAIKRRYPARGVRPAKRVGLARLLWRLRQVFEYAHHFLYAADGTGDRGGIVGLLVRDQAEQVDHARLGHHLDMVRLKLVLGDEGPFHPAGEV